MNLEQAPANMPSQQIPLNFDQETDEEKFMRLKKNYRKIFDQEADLMKLDLQAIETVLRDDSSIAAHRADINAIWQKNQEEDRPSNRPRGFHNS